MRGYLAIATLILTFSLSREKGEEEGIRLSWYEATKVGWGSLFHCSVLGSKPAVVPVESENDSRVLTAEPPDANIQLQDWSPNHLTATVEANTATRVVLNTNYVAGWQVNNRPVEIVSNRPAATVPAGRSTVHFAYQPPGFRLGLALTILTLLLTAFLALKPKPAREDVNQ